MNITYQIVLLFFFLSIVSCVPTPCCTPKQLTRQSKSFRADGIAELGYIIEDQVNRRIFESHVVQSVIDIGVWIVNDTFYEMDFLKGICYSVVHFKPQFYCFGGTNDSYLTDLVIGNTPVNIWQKPEINGHQVFFAVDENCIVLSIEIDGGANLDHFKSFRLFYNATLNANDFPTLPKECKSPITVPSRKHLTLATSNQFLFDFERFKC